MQKGELATWVGIVLSGKLGAVIDGRTVGHMGVGSVVGEVAFFVGGLVILEKILLMNGIGAILWQSALERDYPLALGITLVTAAVVASLRLVGDVVRTAIDPRRREVA